MMSLAKIAGPLALLVALLLQSEGSCRVAASSLEGVATKQDAASESAVSKNALQEMSERAREMMQTITTNVKASWDELAKTEREPGHVLVLALNELRKSKRDLQRKLDQIKGDIYLFEGEQIAEEPVEQHNYEHYEELVREKINKEAAAEAERAKQVGGDASSTIYDTLPANATPEQRKEHAMKSIGRRTKQFLKALFLDELRETAQLILQLWLQQNKSAENGILLGKMIFRMQTKLMVFLVGVFLDLLPVVTGRHPGEFSELFNQNLRDSLTDDDYEETVTTENPYNWMLHTMID